MWAYNYSYPTELYHHGIKGQKWGVRRYQNGDGSLTAEGRQRYGYGEARSKLPGEKEGATILKKGTKFQRIATGANMDYTTGVYTSYKISDMDLYKGVLGRMRVSYMLKNEGDVKLKELSMTAKKDIRLPSKETRIDEFKKLYNDDPEGVKALISEHEKSRYNRSNSGEFNTKNKKQTNTMYEKFNDALALGTNSEHGNVIQRYYDRLSKMGYDAIPDENDIRIGTFKAQAPIIMFDTSRSIGSVKARDLSASEIFSAYNRAMPKKTMRDFFLQGNMGMERLQANSNAEMNRYVRQLAKDKYALNKNYTIEDLAADWGKNRLSARQIRTVSNKMDEGKTHDMAVSETIALGNTVVDIVLNRLGL